MSAYGPPEQRIDITLLPSTAWLLAPSTPGSRSSSPFSYLTVHHLSLSTARSHGGLIAYTYSIFAAEVEAGLSYPQEVAYGQTYTREAFEAYFWSNNVIVAIGATNPASDLQNGTLVEYGVDEARQGRRWEDCVMGFYYVKPNYPGRSSHICNAGFVIPPLQRNFGYGKTLGLSYLHYAPALGFKASIFNLVYTSNFGSIKIWDSLGFQRIGVIPRAGRLRKEDGTGEEWTDAIVYYKSFLDDKEWERALAL